MMRPGRSWNAGKYRYGFNGKENDNEVKGDGNQQDYGMRIYDPRVGKFLSVDPLMHEFPWWTPYAFAGNTPLQAIDLDGGEIKKVINYVDRHNDGTFFVTKTDVDIKQDAYVVVTVSGLKVLGTAEMKAAMTETEYIYQGATIKQEKVYEPIVEGGLKPSAAYDYSKGEIEGKATEDIDYYFNGNKGNIFNRMNEVYERDKKAPDNAITQQDLEAVDAAVAVAFRRLPSNGQNSPSTILYGRDGKRGKGGRDGGGGDVIIGRYRIPRSIFHPSGQRGLKQEILDEVANRVGGKEVYERVVGKNPDINYNKQSGNITLEGTSGHVQGNVYETTLKAEDWLRVHE